MRLCLLVPLILAISAGNEAKPGKSTAAEAAAKIKGAVVRVESQHANAEKPTVKAGVIVDAKGLVIAPYDGRHEDTEFTVTTDSGAKLKAKILDANPKLGVVILKIAAEKPLGFNSFADSDATDVGKIVVAIAWTAATPEGPTASSASVSAEKGKLGDETMLQVDSPGATRLEAGFLFDRKGSVLGVLAIGRSVGLAIPSNRMKELV